MAHRPTNHRRSLAALDPKSTSSSLPSSLKPSTSHHHHHPDPTVPSSTKRINPSHKVRAPQRPTSPPPPAPPPPAAAATKDAHFQAKSFSVSAIFDSSKFSLAKPNHRQPRTALKPDRETHKPSKPSSKEKPKNPSKTQQQGRDFKDKEVKIESVLAGLDMRKLSVSLDGGGGRRRSLGGARVDVSDFLANNGARIVSVDMPPYMQIHAVGFARKTHDSLEKFTARTLASNLKKEFDGVYGPAWHCIVGTSFGSFVTHSVGGFLYFSLDQKMYVLLFKTTVQRAD